MEDRLYVIVRTVGLAQIGPELRSWHIERDGALWQGQCPIAGRNAVAGYTEIDGHARNGRTDAHADVRVVVSFPEAKETVKRSRWWYFWLTGELRMTAPGRTVDENWLRIARSGRERHPFRLFPGG